MGQQQSSQRQQNIGEYKILKTIAPGQFWVRRTKKGDELLLRILTFYIEEEMQEYLRLLQKRKKIKNPHLLELIEYSRLTEQNMCSSMFRIKTVIEYPFKTLKEDIQQRAFQSRYFSEDELWSILYSCCHALFSLYVNQFYHECLNVQQIFIDTEGLVKISDHLLVSSTKNYLALMNEGTTKTDVRYISPELVNLVEDNNFYFYEKQKSDVFILAMIMLEIGNLRPVEYYNPSTKKFNFDAYNPVIKDLKSRYSNNFCGILEKMLQMDFKERPRFENIINSIEQKTTYTGSSNNTSFMTNQENDKNVRESLQFKNYPDYGAKTTNYKHVNFQYQNTPSGPHNRRNPTFTMPPVPSSMRPPPIPNVIHNNYKPYDKPLPSFSDFTQKYNSFSQVPLQPAQNKFTKKDFKLQTWNFDEIMKDIEKKSNHKEYTPYQELIGLTEKKNISPTPNHQGLNNTRLVQKDSSNPVQKPKISLRPSADLALPPPMSISEASQDSIDLGNEYPKILPKVGRVDSIQFSSGRFSQTKFGGIQIVNKLPNVIRSGEFRQSQTDQKRQNKQALVSALSVTSLLPPPQDQVNSLFLNRSSSQIPPNGQFTIVQTSQGGKYQGFILDGKREGVGRQFYADRGLYQGKWKNNKMQGYGKLYYSNQKVAYEGMWAAGMFEGQGKVYNDHPVQTDEEIDYKNLDNVGEKWVSFEGHFHQDKKHGKGFMLFSNGQSFRGQFYLDSAEGKGVYLCKNGDIISGVWKDNQYKGLQ